MLVFEAELPVLESLALLVECCTFLFIYLLVHTSIQQVRRENANDAGTARRRGGRGREPRRNALASDLSGLEAMLVFEAELPVLESLALLVELAALLGQPPRRNA